MIKMPNHTTLTIDNLPSNLEQDAYVIITNPRNEQIERIKQSFWYGVCFGIGVTVSFVLRALSELI